MECAASAQVCGGFGPKSGVRVKEIRRCLNGGLNVEWREVAPAKSSPRCFAGVADERRKEELAFIAHNSMRFRSRLASVGSSYATSRIRKSGVGPMLKPARSFAASGVRPSFTPPMVTAPICAATMPKRSPVSSVPTVRPLMVMLAMLAMTPTGSALMKTRTVRLSHRPRHSHRFRGILPSCRPRSIHFQ